MNKKSILFKIAALTAVFTLNASLYVALNKKATEVNAYSTTSLPTTIDLNDNTPTQIRNYYSSLNSLDASERQGNNLLKNLKPILKNGQKYLSYDSNNGRDIWDVYCIVDRDWVKSPITSLPAAAGTYNQFTNKIENYKWGGNSAKYENPYLHVLYYNRNREPVAQAYGDHGNSANNPTGINREHIWPKGSGFNTEPGGGGARGDIMHLWAAHGHTNNKHKDFYYGYVDKTKSYDDEASDTIECAGNLLGLSKTLGGSTKVFEPQDDDKGDIARACFYMVARYNYLSGSDSDGIDQDNPNLELVNSLSSYTGTGYDSTTTKTGKIGILQDLLEWNRLDPPDQFEIHRNNLCYNNFTGNRNPFIDFPSWADAIWGVSENGNYNSTPTKSASPTSDPINTFVVNNFSISESTLELEVGDTAEIYGSNATSNITWSVDDNTVVSLDKNSTPNNEAVTITALKAGSATITATSGGQNATCTVTVTGGGGEQTGDLELASSIATGDTVYLACSYSSGQYNGPRTTNTTVIGDYVSYTTAPNSNTYPLEVCAGTENNTYAFKIKTGTYANNYLSWSDDNNSLDVSETLNINSSWTVSIDGDNNATIANAATPARVIWWNVSYPRFACYTGKTAGASYKNVQLWKATAEPVVPAPTVDECLDNSSPYTELLATEGVDTRDDTESIVFKDAGIDNAAVLTTFDLTYSSLSFSKATGASDPAYYDNGKNARLYKGNTLTITSTKVITSIVFSFTTNYSDGLTASIGTLSNGTWNGNAYAVTFTNPSGNSNQIRFTELSITVSSVISPAVRFGMSIPKTSWNAIRDEYGISDYGIMVVKENTLINTYGVSSLEEAYYANKTLKISRVNTYRDPGTLDEDTYAFTVKMNMSSENNYGIVYHAAAFIVVDDQYYFLDDVVFSINSLASAYLTNGGSSLSNKALTLLSVEH